MPVEVREPGVGPSTADNGPSWGRKAAIAAALIALVVAGVLVVRVAVGSDSDGKAAEPERQLPPGLTVGDASAAYELATDDVYGRPTGFPQTEAGAVEALTASISWGGFGQAELPTVQRIPIRRAGGYGPEFDEVADEEGRKFQERAGLDTEGRPIDGQPGDRFYNECLPQFGLYRSVVPDEVDADKPDVVGVGVFMPCIRGVGSPTHIDDLRIDWVTWSNLVRWKDGIWTEDKSADFKQPKAPQPRDLLRPNVSVEERATFFPPPSGGASPGDAGWRLYKGWSEEWPTDLLGEEPKS